MYQGITPTPDPGFVRRLKAYDPNLSVEFNRRYGKFAIMQRRAVGSRIVMLVRGGENPAGWRQPDQRDLDILSAGDFHRGPSLKERVVRGEAAIINAHAEQARKNREEIRDMTKDGKYQLIRTLQDVFNLGKGTRPFRQITVKPKGKVFSHH